MPPSSRGLGQLPFTEQTGIRIPLGVNNYQLNQLESITKFYHNLTNRFLLDYNKYLLLIK